MPKNPVIELIATPSLPRQRVGDNGLQIVKTRLPFERRIGTVAGGDEVRWVACAAGRELDLNVRCICCCMLITEPGNRQYNLRVPLIVGTSVHTHRIPNHIY
jgi:hypothetical protein